MLEPKQILAVHGLPEIPWDYAPIPSAIWEKTERMPNGCWHTDDNHALSFRKTIISRLYHIETSEIYAMTPTCGSRLCINPAHLCVTLVTPLSYKER